MSRSGNHIVDGLEKGDKEAFARIYTTHFSRLLFFARRLIDDPQEAEDIVSDVFVRLWGLGTGFESLANVTAYLYIAVRNACFDFLKYASRQSSHKQELLYSSPHTEEEVLHHMFRTELLHQIVSEIDQLPPQYKAVCQLVFFEGLDNDETASRLGISEKTVRNIKSSALKEIRTVFLKKKLLIWMLVFRAVCIEIPSPSKKDPFFSGQNAAPSVVINSYVIVIKLLPEKLMQGSTTGYLKY